MRGGTVRRGGGVGLRALVVVAVAAAALVVARADTAAADGKLVGSCFDLGFFFFLVLFGWCRYGETTRIPRCSCCSCGACSRACVGSVGFGFVEMSRGSRGIGSFSLCSAAAAACKFATASR